MFKVKNSKSIFTLCTYLITWICLLSAYPYVFNQILWLPQLSVLCVCCFIALFSVCCLYNNKIKLFKKQVLYIISIQSMCWILYVFLHRDILYIERIVYLLLANFMLLCLYNCRGGIYRFIEKYNTFILLMALGGVFCFLLVFLVGFQPILNFVNKDGRTAYFYILTSTNVLIGNIIRYAGYFDEPGAMAYWGIWALIINNLYINNKKLGKWLMISLSFTFSLAYYIQIFLYLIFFKLRTFKHLLISIFVIVFITCSLYYTSLQYPVLYNFTFGRIEMNDAGELKGDNRTELAEKAKIEFEHAPVFGNGITKMSKLEYMSENPYETLAYDGIVGTIITYLPLLYLWYIGGRNVRLSIIILLVGFLQRPFHHFIIFYFMIYCLVLMELYQKYENTSIRCRN